MNSVAIVSAFFLIFIAGSHVNAQVYSMDVKWSFIYTVPADPCKYEARGATRIIMNNQNSTADLFVEATVYAIITGTVDRTDTFGPVSTSLHSNKATIDRTWRKSLPTFGTYNVRPESTHSGSVNGVSVGPYTDTTGVDKDFNCELYGDGGDDEDPTGDEAPCVTNPYYCLSPILLDLGDDGFHFGEAGIGVHFDMLGNGEPAFMQWVRPGEDDAFLVHDINDNGLADDGSELFGNGTRLLLQGDALAPNGFVGLAQFDRPELGGNDDGFISGDDQIWKYLYLWLDADADGISTSREMTPLASLPILRLETIPFEVKQFDSSGNWLRFFARAQRNDGETRDMVDVFFRLLVQF